MVNTFLFLKLLIFYSKKMAYWFIKSMVDTFLNPGNNDKTKTDRCVNDKTKTPPAKKYRRCLDDKLNSAY
jgi:hypothetical protein